MDNKIKNIDTLMVRFLQGTCTEEEKTQFFLWLGDKENEASFFQMKEIFDARQRIPGSKEEKETVGHTKHIPRMKQSNPLRITQWMRYAAIIAVMFGASFIFYLLQKDSPGETATYVKQMVIHNTRGVYRVTLPDGSQVWLHGGTTLTYPEQFSDSLRIVDLQGEAYFAVQADVAHPFVVQTPTAKVCATGTEFNITAYPGDKMTTTTLVKGVVDIQPNHLGASVKLKPSQQALVSANDDEVRVVKTTTTKASGNKEEPVVIQDINVDLYTDWKDGVYRFKNEPFQNIVLRLEKMYGVDIRIENEDLKKTSFSGMFTTDYSLKEVFEIIDISNPISYTVKDKVVSIRNKKK